MFSRIFSSITPADRQAAVERLIHSSSPTADFYLMTILSVVVATFGIFIDSSAVLIGSMLIAPLLSPVVSLALGLATADNRVIYRSAITIAKATGLGVAISFILTILFFNPLYQAASPFVGAHVTLPYLIVAIAGGIAVTVALLKPDLSALLPGAAVAVALIPPVASIGIGLALVDLELVRAALIMLLLNIGGIATASLIVFSLVQISHERREVVRALRAEERAEAETTAETPV